MASIRDQRRAQRKRGAASHSNRDIDFALTFPPQVTSVKPNYRSEGDSQSFSTQIENGTIHTPRPIARLSDVVGTSLERFTDREVASKSSANISAKRQKLDLDHVPEFRDRAEGGLGEYSHIDSEREQSQLRDIDVFKGMETTDTHVSGQTVVPSAASPIIETSQQNQLLSSHAGSAIASTNRSSSLGAAIGTYPYEHSIEVEESPRHAPGSGQKVNRLARIEAGIVVPATATSLPASPTDLSVHVLSRRKIESIVSPRNSSPVLEASIQMPSQPSVGSNAKQHDGGLSNVSGDLRFTDDHHRSAGEGTIGGIHAEAAEDIDDLQVAVRLQAVRQNTSASSLIRSPAKHMTRKTSGVSEDSDGHHDRGGVPMRFRTLVTSSRLSPALQRQPKIRRASHVPKRGKRRLRESVKIPVRRVVELPSLAEDSDTDADILNLPMPYVKRGNINGLDVLAEFCKETIDSARDAMEEQIESQEDDRLGRERIVKLRAIEAWGDTLGVTFCEMTNHLDENYRLQCRVKSSAKELKQLREKLARLRKQREEVAIHKDSVRFIHEQSSNTAEGERELNSGIDDIQMALGSCDTLHTTSDEPLSSLWARLRAVIALVGAVPQNGGILQKVQSFNTFLEWTARALEGRI